MGNCVPIRSVSSCDLRRKTTIQSYHRGQGCDLGNCVAKTLRCCVCVWKATNQELSGTPNPWYFLKSIASANGRRITSTIGGVLQYKLEVYCGVSLSPKLRSQQGTALKTGGVLRYKLEVYRQYFSDTLYGFGGS